jgi:hypothetical protein
MSDYTHETVLTRFVENGGIRYAYRRFGEPGRPPLLWYRDAPTEVRVTIERSCSLEPSRLSTVTGWVYRLAARDNLGCKSHNADVPLLMGIK